MGDAGVDVELEGGFSLSFGNQLSVGVSGIPTTSRSWNERTATAIPWSPSGRRTGARACRRQQGPRTPPIPWPADAARGRPAAELGNRAVGWDGSRPGTATPGGTHRWRERRGSLDPPFTGWTDDPAAAALARDTPRSLPG